MFAFLCSAATGLLGCELGWVDGSYVGVPEYPSLIAGSEAECFSLATTAYADATYLTWQPTPKRCRSTSSRHKARGAVALS